MERRRARRHPRFLVSVVNPLFRRGKRHEEGTADTKLPARTPAVQEIVETALSSGDTHSFARHCVIEHARCAKECVSPDDAATGFNILHLVANREAALRGVHRLLKPGGLFISKTPCVGEMGVFIRLLVPLMQAFGQAPYVALFSAEELERDIEAAGFEIVARERHASRGKDRRPFLVARKL